ncbi:DUF459 domain-containing protein [Chelatococcus daeguensis]|uniref:SGNH hydrolase-type esterase domain-containing protein n=2 Tax=Chelatococcus TaxID=28209 RepID=A0AAC9NZN1_9HYPH|nr:MULTISPECIES: SGNH family hydrolase [Chelatococcus]APF38318.1 hypothetical protein BOQ54_14115 [Chelatococcus daeguensis]KZE36016.1 hypothetical protein AVW15_11275 [Chelatococcus daeguensis]MBM3084151.1 DUF459 domain-containing protein [Chelatococcus daeguensis]CUA84744.1 Uncharacterized protein Ga0061061_101526 [Chelatococcus sambhunathii]
MPGRSLIVALLVVAGCIFAAAVAHAQQDPLTRFLNSIFQPKPPPQVEQAPRRSSRPADPRPRQTAPRAAPEQRGVAERTPRVEVDTYVVVMGDSLAELLTEGLAETLAEAADVAIYSRARGDTGLVRSDFYDWSKAVQELVANPARVSIGVMMIGANDRQGFRTPAGEVEHGTPEWRTLYTMRVDEIIRTFGEKRIPLVWVGLPPMKGERLSADMLALNAIFRERVTAAGGQYVDIWEAFLDADGRFSAFGPDVSGQNARLRTSDGVHFTKAGARKAAHFAALVLRRLIDAHGSAQQTVLPLHDGMPGLDSRDPVERMIDASIPSLPEPNGLISVSSKPVAGPILPLTAPDAAPGGVLVAAPAGAAQMDQLAERVFILGDVPQPKQGRVDDFSWPRQP